MKRLSPFFIVALCGVFIFVVLAPTLTLAGAKSPTPTDLSVPIDGKSSVNTFTDYINLIYQFGMGFGILLAVGIIAFRGIQYTTSELIPSKEEARDGIKAALLGLLLLLGAGLVLYLINPDLLSLNQNQLTGPKAPNSLPEPPPYIGGSVTNLTASPDGKKLTWSYSPPPEKPLFEIQYRDLLASPNPYKPYGNVTVLSFDLPKEFNEPGTSWEFRVRTSLPSFPDPYSTQGKGPWSNTVIVKNP